MSNKEQSISLSVRLLKEGLAIAAALRAGHSMTPISIASGTLYVGQAHSRPPTWFEFLEGLTRTSLQPLYNQSCSAILFLDIQLSPSSPSRIMALSFGSGHHSLDPIAFERNFGLRIALNSITSSNLRTLDVATLDATTFQKRIQASRNSELQGFGIDTERDLLRLASGIPSDSSFARTLAGKDALTIHTTLAPSDVAQKCKTALELFQKNTYKTDYPWVDYVLPVNDPALIGTLDNEAFKEIQELMKGVAADIHLVLPDIVNPEDGYAISYYGVGLKSGTKKTFSQMEIEDYIEQINAGRPAEIVDMAALKTSHEIRVVVEGRGDEKRKQRLYDCFVMEVSSNNFVYVLFSGTWYQIDQAFHTTVNNSFNSLVKVPFLLSTKSKNERQLILELDANADLLNLDQVKISPSGAPGANLEPCDFFCRSKRFIHLKDGHASAPISHLWNQGLVSAEAFVRDGKFRKDLRAQATVRQKAAKKSNFETQLPDGRSLPVPKDFKVIFGIMRSRNKRSKMMTLPFFSKVSLRTVADRIQLMGYTVEVHLIEKV